MRRLLLLSLLAAALAGGSAGGIGAADPPVLPVCSPAPSDCSGWYRSNVTVTWNYGSLTPIECTNVTQTTDTTGRDVSCSVDYLGGTYTRKVTLRRDTVAPSTSASVPRPPDANGWYNHALAPVFSGSDATSGVASCTGTTYSGPDTADAGVSGTCTDAAGNVSAPVRVGFKYDATAPAVTGAPARAADANGWYNHAVPVAFTGTDGVSGVASCTATTYAGPDSTGVAIPGSCTDGAGNRGDAQPVALRYDATAPTIKVSVKPGNSQASLAWSGSPDVAAVEIVRSPGRGKQGATVVYRGAAKRYLDHGLRNGIRYSYRVVARDLAGNAHVANAGALPEGPLRLPIEGAKVGAPPLLRWKAVRGASYYNVQLTHDGKKVLSVWPASPRLKLAGSWRFDGHSYTLGKGLYRWYVWPGKGARTAARYGKLLGSSWFVVR